LGVSKRITVERSHVMKKGMTVVRAHTGVSACVLSDNLKCPQIPLLSSPTKTKTTVRNCQELNNRGSAPPFNVPEGENMGSVPLFHRILTSV